MESAMEAAWPACLKQELQFRIQSHLAGSLVLCRGLSNIVGIVKLRTLQCAGHVARIVQTINTHRLIVKKSWKTFCLKTKKQIGSKTSSWMLGSQAAGIADGWYWLRIVSNGGLWQWRSDSVVLVVMAIRRISSNGGSGRIVRPPGNQTTTSLLSLLSVQLTSIQQYSLIGRVHVERCRSIFT